ncbi:MAG: hypothetical protein N2376_01055, partial [Clostridia bacterium]|nr:hypothetical protein [Clostridia bacterium]
MCSNNHSRLRINSASDLREAGREVEHLPEGIILKGIGGFYEVQEHTDDKRIFTCKVRGVHRKEGGTTPLVGDRVTFKILNENKLEGHIDHILERRNAFIRPPVANIDQLAI